jgi:uncharacterized HAD superfamily protein
MLKLAIDLDGVLAHFNISVDTIIRRVVPRFESHEGIVYPSTWNWSDIISKDEWDAIWNEINSDPNYWANIPPYEDSVNDLIQFMTKRTDDPLLFYITSRKPTGGISVESQTYDWLKRYLLLFDYQTTLLVVHTAAEKVNLVRALNIDGIIDDYVPTVEACRKYCKACLLNRPWNQSAKQGYDINTVNTLQDFLNEF